MLYYVLLVSTMQQCGSALSTNISPPPCASRAPHCPPPLPSRLSQSTTLNSLSYETTFPQSSILHVAKAVFRATLSICSTLSFPQCAHKFVSTSAFLFLPLKEVHQGYFSRFHAYVLIYNICFSLPDLPHSVKKALDLSTSVQLTQICSFSLAE